ncbi:hemolysin XhlA family protein [Paenibacillus sp. P25]|nr:hemolysin XhlA family protein [Paenibacillus sp. P25]
MSTPETKMLSEIALKVGRLEVLQESNAKAIQDMAMSVNRLVDKLDKSDDLAREADQRARSAHHRLDELKDQEPPTMRDQMKEIRANQRWLIGTTISICALFVVAIGLLLKH